MSDIWIYSLVSVLVVSLVSLIGVVTLAVKRQFLQRILVYLVSFSAGVLLGDVFLHLLPELAETRFGVTEGLAILGGIFVFFVLERFILWHHSHVEHEERVHSVPYLVIFGDGLHNFIDGVIIAASFLVDIQLGIATTAAVIAHEIPHEIGDFAVLLHGGWSRRKALLANFASALTAVIGALVVLVTSRASEEVPTILIAFAAATFIYIAMADLIPELHKETGKRSSVYQFLWFAIGTGFMALLLLFE